MRPITSSRAAKRQHRLAKAVTAAAASVAVLLGGCAVAHATDTLPWGQFNPDWAAGANQPYNHGYTGLDILNWSPEADQDSQYLRARVPLQPRISANATTQRNPDLPADTEMMNIAGDYGNAFFESFQDNNVFSQYLFNYWQYTDYYGTWHGQPTQGVDKGLYDIALNAGGDGWKQKWFEFGTLNLPNPAYTNAAHKNGAKSIATIFFSDSDRGEQVYQDLLQGKRADGTFPVADKLVEIAEYYGFDGYFFNQENSSGVAAGDIDDYRAFLKQLRDAGLYVHWYDAVGNDGSGTQYENAFDDQNSEWVKDPKLGQVSDSMFLNYWFNDSMLSSSAQHAKDLGLDPKKTVFAGIEAGKDRFTSVNTNHLSQNLDDNGKPKVSIAALGADFVSHELQEDYGGDDTAKTKPENQHSVFDRERRLWTGSSTGDPKNTDGWPGFASQIAERSVIGGPVFSTTFNTGHGLEWRDSGKVSSDAEWGNINLQDTPVTWQWWIDSSSDDKIQADFDYGPDYKAADRFDYQKIGAYEGGDSLVLSGKLSGDNTIRLFKTDLEVKDGSKAEVTLSKPSSDDSKLQLALIFADDTSTVVPVDLIGGKATDGWKTVTVDLSQYAGRSIATIGLIAKAGTSPIDDWQVNVGKLTITDGANYTPEAPKGLSIEKLDTSTGELTADWKLGDYAQTKNYLLYLDDTFLGGRYDENYYVKKLPRTSGTLKLYAIGADGSRSLAAETSLDETKTATDVKVETTKDGKATVSWTAPAAGGDATVILATDRGSWKYAAKPFSVTKNAGAATSVEFDGVPVDGARYIAQVKTNGVVSTAQGEFTDATIEPYPVEKVKWTEGHDFSGSSIWTATLVRPEIQDWRSLKVTERWTDDEGRQQESGFRSSYTYGATPNDEAQKAGFTSDLIIRGRSTPASYSITPQHGGDLYVSVTDYHGNTSEPVRIPKPTDPKTVYYIDAGVRGTDVSDAYAEAAKAGTLLNGRADQTFATKDGWGSLAGVKLYAGDKTDTSDPAADGLVATGKTLRYKVKLDAGSYRITAAASSFGSSRTMSIKAQSTEGTVQAKDAITVDKGHANATGSVELTLAEPRVVTVTLTRTAGANPTLAWLQVDRTA